MNQIEKFIKESGVNTNGLVLAADTTKEIKDIIKSLTNAEKNFSTNKRKDLVESMEWIDEATSQISQLEKKIKKGNVESAIKNISKEVKKITTDLNKFDKTQDVKIFDQVKRQLSDLSSKVFKTLSEIDNK